MSKPVISNVPSLYVKTDAAYCNHLLDQHRHFVEITMKYWGHIETANHFFLSLHTVILSGFTYLLTTSVRVPAAVLAMLVVVSCAMALQWLMILRSLQRLNHVRHEIIQEWESMLPAQPYQVEKERLFNDKSPRHRQYLKIQKLYMPLPLLVLMSYLVFGFLIFFDVRVM